MQYPLISEYINAILNAEENFATMTDLRPVLNDDGSPIMTSGNFAVVFKMKDERDGKLYAVKCFTREQKGRAENYRMIADELGKVSSPYITPIKWLDDELFVDTKQTEETEFPVLLMDWIEGPTLSAFLQSIADQLAEGKVFKDNEYEMFELRCLPANFLRMASWLLKQPFAHGDLKPDNIIVQEDGYCVLVDYDGMYVPAMQGMPLTCMSTPNFTHPSQTNPSLNKDIDNYAIAVIALSLQAFAIKPNMIAESPDYCVVTKQQALKLHELAILNDKELMADNNIRLLLSLFLHCLSQNKLETSYFEHAIAEILVPKNLDIYNTGICGKDFENLYEDKNKVMYRLDGRKVLGVNRNHLKGNLDNYRIREGVLVISDLAFSQKINNGIHLPDSVVSIGRSAFESCVNMSFCNMPKSVIHIGGNPWAFCSNIKQLKCDSPHFVIDKGILYSADYKIAHALIYRNRSIEIDQRTSIISSLAFASSIFLKQSVSVENVKVSNVNVIGPDAFSHCASLKQITMSPCITKIGDRAFYGCNSLHSLTIPSSVSEIADTAFLYCDNMNEIIVEDGDFIYSSLDGVLFRKPIILDSFTELIMFPTGKCVSHYMIPTNVKRIKTGAFRNCKHLESISIPKSVKQVMTSAFRSCSMLKSLTLMSSEIIIDENAFDNCNSIETINVPKGETERFKSMLPKNLHPMITPVSF